MTQQIGFDSEKYVAAQTAAINERVARFRDKLCLEFGGKLIFDLNAARVLQGFDPNVKKRLLQQLNDRAEVIRCIFAGDIEKKMRADFGITYDSDALKLFDDLGEWNIVVRAVVSTRYDDSRPPRCSSDVSRTAACASTRIVPRAATRPTWTSS